ncbi:EamA family transporter [Candidatus Saccharibacteria bacterium]|nr:EamA family transporter [Candidatus Saccharibacteria bacterium]
MNNFLLSLIAPALWAVSNHFDKYIVGRYFRDTSVGAMMVFSALIGIVVMPIAFIFQDSAFSIGSIPALLISLNGCLYLVAVQPYLKALRISDASTSIPMFQIIPVITFVLAKVVLKESLTSNQLLGGLLIVLGAIIISFEMIDGRKLKLHGDALGLMFLSSLIFSVNFLLFKYFAINSSFWTTTFWESVGFIGFGLALLVFVKSWRRDFINVFTKQKLATELNITNEAINTIAKITFNYVSLLAPITLAWIGVGFQPVFVLVYSVLLAAFFPHINNEKVRGKHLVQKIVSIIIMMIGAYILNR